MSNVIPYMGHFMDNFIMNFGLRVHILFFGVTATKQIPFCFCCGVCKSIEQSPIVKVYNLHMAN
jgi:hypothetical protein